MRTLSWQKSSYSPDGSNCIYVAARTPDTIYVRESDKPEVVLTTKPEHMRALIQTLKTRPLPH